MATKLFWVSFLKERLENVAPLLHFLKKLFLNKKVLPFVLCHLGT